jgi:hypothetical protein
MGPEVSGFTCNGMRVWKPRELGKAWPVPTLTQVNFSGSYRCSSCEKMVRTCGDKYPP